MAQYSFPKGSPKLSVLYRTQEQAEPGKEWFEKIAGELLPLGIALGTLSEAFEKMIRRTYANWADEPIPIFVG